MVVIERSLGNSNNFEIITNKSAFIRTVQCYSVRVPHTVDVTRRTDLAKYAASTQFPVILKCDRTYGGKGVAIAWHRDELTLAHRNAQAGRLLRSMLRRPSPKVLFDCMASLTITAQQFIDGCPANQAVVCWNGEVLAAVTVKAIKTNPSPTGPATVVELIAHPGIDAAVQTVVRNLGLSGFCGFDFVIESSSNEAFMLELNPRATDTSNIACSGVPTLADAVFRAISRRQPPDVGPRGGPDGAIIAFFPKEWIRCPDSRYLGFTHYVVPETAA
jgi:predicted ATP-grasp superfamily ATP-dependent carboligase